MASLQLLVRCETEPCIEAHARAWIELIPGTVDEEFELALSRVGANCWLGSFRVEAPTTTSFYYRIGITSMAQGGWRLQIADLDLGCVVLDDSEALVPPKTRLLGMCSVSEFPARTGSGPRQALRYRRRADSGVVCLEDYRSRKQHLAVRR
ncbi:MAG: hypothetical protein OXT09_18585 [Myxococcales bacterium]|nr:hypothetical protein [Myxococcales bacterium]